MGVGGEQWSKGTGQRKPSAPSPSRGIRSLKATAPRKARDARWWGGGIPEAARTAGAPRGRGGVPGEPAPPAAPAHAAARGSNPPSLARSQPSVWPWPLDCQFLRWAGFGRPFAPRGVPLPSPFVGRPSLSFSYSSSFSVNSSAPLRPVAPLSLRALLPLLLRGPVTSTPVSHPDPRPSSGFLSPVFPLLLHRPSASSFCATPHPGNLFQTGIPTRS